MHGAVHHPQLTSPPGRLQSLRLREGGLEISTDRMPPFLLEANAALQAGQQARATALLGDANVAVVERIIQEQPCRTDLMYILAKLLRDTGQADRAEPWLKRLLEYEPHPVAYNDLGHIVEKTWARLTEATACFRRAVDLDPDCPEYWMDLGTSLIRTGRLEEGLAWLDRAVQKRPDHPVIRPIWVWNQHYRLDDRRFFFDQYRWLARIQYPGNRARQGHANVPDPDRRLRVGFLSPDFRYSPPAAVLDLVLDGLPRDRLEVYGYGNVPRPDAVTGRLAGKVEVYRPVHGMDDLAVVRRIEEDRIDILVEVGGFCQDHRVGLLAYQPAPIQVDLGGLSTLGLDSVEYRITDSILDPPDSQPYYGERLTYLAGGADCFCPPQVSPCVASQPAKANGHVTFGVFNHPAKITAGMLSCWTEILKAVPDSHLLIKAPALTDAGVRQYYRSELARRGVSPDRVHTHGVMDHYAHLESLGRVDLALDTYPYNGCMTTLEGLWMGVPTVSLAGNTFVSREGLSILGRMGLEVFVAASPQEYVAKAVAFAGQVEHLAAIRASLRDKMLGSVLCDAGRVGREMESAFRQMWRRWCQGRIREMD